MATAGNQSLELATPLGETGDGKVFITNSPGFDCHLFTVPKERKVTFCTGPFSSQQVLRRMRVRVEAVSLVGESLQPGVRRCLSVCVMRNSMSLFIGKRTGND